MFSTMLHNIPKPIIPLRQEEAMTGWELHYASRVGKSYVNYVGEVYKTHIDTILELSQGVHRPTLIEAGCGIGTVTAALQRRLIMAPCTLIGFDRDRGQVRNAHRNLEANGIPTRSSVHMGGHGAKWSNTATFHAGDILNHSSYSLATANTPDIIHSHGVLEHFSDEDIWHILMTQMQTGARYLVHYVPLIGHGTPSFGDERLLHLGEWVDTFCPTFTRSFNDGKDVTLVWDVEKFLHRFAS